MKRRDVEFIVACHVYNEARGFYCETPEEHRRSLPGAFGTSAAEAAYNRGANGLKRAALAGLSPDLRPLGALAETLGATPVSRLGETDEMHLAFVLRLGEALEALP